MSNQTALSRKFRPQCFKDVVGQKAIVRTLKNSITQNKVPQVLLFAGPHGSGKTSLARIFAKALNCLNPQEGCEPCTQCRSCLEIAKAEGMDVIELDGASNRGIEEIRKIKESVGYCTSYAKNQIYIIDEVHMLTKEAFNALLKTLEEPPKATLFFFATTEPQKLPTTILSRCQRFDLIKLTPCEIEEKLNTILKELKIEAEKDALVLIAKRAKGALRDAESLLEQVITFHCQKVTLKAVEQAFGLVPAELFFKLDQAVEKGDTAFAFSLAKDLFDAGISLVTYLELFSEHLRTLLMIRLSSKVENVDFLPQIKEYQTSAKIYTDDQLIYLIDLVLEWQQKKQLTASERTVMEAIHLKVIKSKFYISPQMLLERLAALEKSLGHIGEEKTIAAPIVVEQEKPKEIEAISISSAPPSSRTETLLQFISVELEGKIQR